MKLQVFLVAFFVSLVGSIPPGTINITAMQMSMKGKIRAAYFLALGATGIELIYATGVVRFQIFLNNNIDFTHHFLLVTGLVMMVLGIQSLLSRTSSSSIKVNTQVRGRSGFLKGLILGLLNPLAIPFWLAVTTYLQANAWITLGGIHSSLYLIGLTAGSLVTLFIVVRLGSNFQKISDKPWLVHILPGITFLSLGCYNLWQWAFNPTSP